MKYYNKWTEDRIFELAKDYQVTKDINELAEKYHMKVNSLKATLSSYGIKRGRKYCGQWTEEQEEFLRKEYPRTRFPVLLAQTLGKSVSAIRTRALILGVHRKKRGYKHKGFGYE